MRQGILQFEVEGALYRQSFGTDGRHRITEVVKQACAMQASEKMCKECERCAVVPSGAVIVARDE